PRVKVNHGQVVWTRTDVASLVHTLEVANKRLLDQLTEHIWLGRSDALALRTPERGRDSVEQARSAEHLRDYYRDLQRDERWLAADLARDVGLIDSIEGS